MMKQLFILITVCMLMLGGCAPTSSPEELSTGPDPTVVDSDHYKVEFENDRVRVLRITYGPGEKSIMHYHPAGVAVFLTDQKVKFTFPDGSTQEVETKTGDALWTEAGQHLPENLIDKPMELVLVELKEAAGGEADEISSPSPDATEADPDHYKVEFENDRVRIVRVTFGPNEKSAMLYHPARVAVFLKNQKTRFSRGDGSTDIGEAKFGEAVWAEAGDLQVEELGQPTELILVEIME